MPWMETADNLRLYLACINDDGRQPKIYFLVQVTASVFFIIRHTRTVPGTHSCFLAFLVFKVPRRRSIPASWQKRDYL